MKDDESAPGTPEDRPAGGNTAVNAANRTTEDHVAAWLESSGSALEMRVARAFRRTRPFSVVHSRYYIDNGTLRETDVVAAGQRWGRNVALHLVIECKSSREHPWVLFQDDEIYLHNDLDLVETFIVQESPGATISQLQGIHNAPLVYSHEPHGYQIADTSAKNREAYTAVAQAVSGVGGLMADVPQDQNPPLLSIFIPVVVTAAPLFSARLDASGQVELTEVTRRLLITRLRPVDQLHSAWIVTEEGLPQFVTDACTTVEALSLTDAPPSMPPPSS
jgi:hypothetical protein